MNNYKVVIGYWLLPPAYELQRQFMFSVCQLTGSGEGGKGVPQSLVLWFFQGERGIPVTGPMSILGDTPVNGLMSKF